MRVIPYDASRQALYHPETGETVFPLPRKPSDDLICAEASRLAYKLFESVPSEREKIEQALANVGFREFEPFNQDSSQGFAMWNAEQETALVAFRGTQQDFGDFADDLNALKRDWPQGGWVHGGFLEAFNTIWPGIDAWLGNHPGKRLFTGHSLGAALATLAASTKRTDPVTLITIGSPRVGNAEFASTLTGVQMTRYVDCCDLVCRVPPAIFGFQHVIAESYIDHDGHVRKGSAEAEIQQDQHAGREDYFLHHSWKKGEVDVRDLADHAPINYVNVLLSA